MKVRHIFPPSDNLVENFGNFGYLAFLADSHSKAVNRVCISTDAWFQEHIESSIFETSNASFMLRYLNYSQLKDRTKSESNYIRFADRIWI